MIEAQNLTKRYGATLAVDRLSFTVHPGTLTGFLGPNGSGKSTTMRMIMGLDGPDGGQARIGGFAYPRLRWPLREVGALLEARQFHPGRTARSHLLALAAANAIPRSRVEEVLGVIGRGRLLADTTVAEMSARGGGNLEDAFFALTADSAQYRGDPGVRSAGQAQPPASR